MNVVDESLEANLKEEIDLTIEAKLAGKYEKSEIISLTQKYHNKIKTGVDAVDNVRILLSFDMGWQKKGTGHTYDSHSVPSHTQSVHIQFLYYIQSVHAQ